MRNPSVSACDHDWLDVENEAPDLLTATLGAKLTQEACLTGGLAFGDAGGAVGHRFGASGGLGLIGWVGTDRIS
jgi:hypothetical protein